MHAWVRVAVAVGCLSTLACSDASVATDAGDAMTQPADVVSTPPTADAMTQAPDVVSTPPTRDAAPDAHGPTDGGMASASDASFPGDAAGDAVAPRDAAADATLIDASDAGPLMVGDGGAPSNQATSWLINPAHTNAVADPSLAPRLGLAWTRTFSLGTETYPLIAGGLVYLLVQIDGLIGNKLVALDEATGDTRWGPVDLGAQFVKNDDAYDSGRIFVTDRSDGGVRAFDAATGAPLWTTTVSAFSDAPPTAYGGLLYIGGNFTVTALDESTGTTVWTADVDQEFTNTPAVTNEAVFVATGRCADTFALDRQTGATIWQYTENVGSCSGTGGAPTVFGGRVWIPVVSSVGEVVLDEATGAPVTTYSGFGFPAFVGNTAIESQRPLTALDLSTGGNAWTFAGDGHILLDPVVAGGTVYVGSDEDRLLGLDLTTGAQTWQEQVGADPFPGTIFAGEGLLLTIGGGPVFQLIAYRHVEVPDAGVFDRAPDGGCPASGCLEPAVTLSAESGNGLAIDANRVYWTNGNGDIRAMPKTGGQPTTLSSNANTEPVGIAVDANNLYWAIPTVTQTAVMKMPLIGGAAQALISNAYIPQEVVVGPTQVYFSGAVEPVVSVPIAGGAVTVLSNGGVGLGALAIDATNLYFSTDVTYELPLAGGTAVPLGPAASALASDGTYLYYVANSIDVGVVGRISVAGGTPAILIDGRQGYLGGVAVDGDNVYWSEGSLTMMDGAIAAMPKGGGRVAVLAAGLVLAPRTVVPATIAVDDTGVYFASSSQIGKIPKQH